MPSRWSLDFCAGYIVPPGRGKPPTVIAGLVKGSKISVATLPLAFFAPLFEASFSECPIGIRFKSTGGQQQNAVRDMVRRAALGSGPDRAAAAETLAQKLAAATDKRSPLGLFVVLVGRADEARRIALWKFPADKVLRASSAGNALSINVISDAFSQESTYFKAAVFEGGASLSSFWGGRVEDRQARHSIREVSQFWIDGFLDAEPELKDAHATRLLAKALREAFKGAQLAGERDALLNAAMIAKLRAGRTITLESFIDELLPPGIGTNVRTLFAGYGAGTQLRNPFRLDSEILDQQLRVRTLVLDSGYSVRGPLDTFGDMVSVDSLDGDRIRVSLEGAVESESVTTR